MVRLDTDLTSLSEIILYLIILSIFIIFLTFFKEKWPNILMIFTIGLTTRFIVNNYFDINVFVDYIKWPSVLYYLTTIVVINVIQFNSIFDGFFQLNKYLMGKFSLNIINLTLDNVIDGIRKLLGGYGRDTMTMGDFTLENLLNVIKSFIDVNNSKMMIMNWEGYSLNINDNVGLSENGSVMCMNSDQSGDQQSAQQGGGQVNQGGNPISYNPANTQNNTPANSQK